MKKQDLKTGMLVELRNGDVCMIINDVMVDKYEYIALSGYHDDLTCISRDEYSIIAVSKQMTANKLTPMHWTKEVILENLLWQRPKPKQDPTKFSID